MKYITYILLAASLLTSCTNEEDYKNTRAEVITVHDKVMIDVESAIRNKMKLDTLAADLDSLKNIDRNLDTLSERSKIKTLQQQLELADTKMNDWMHAFNAETDGKSNKEAVQYFKNEKKKITAIDSLYQTVLKSSEEYLSKFKR